MTTSALPIPDALFLAFNRIFRHWKIILVPDDLVAGEPLAWVQSGWRIYLLLETDDQGTFLDVYAQHRMTDDKHVRLRPNAESNWFPASSSMRKGGATPEEEKRLEAEYVARECAVRKALDDKFGDPKTVWVRTTQGPSP